MVRRFIVVDDTTVSRGRVMTGSPFDDIYGQPIARVDDQVVCALHGPTAIATGDVTVTFAGRTVACEGDRCFCDCRLISLRQNGVYIDSGLRRAAAPKAGPEPDHSSVYTAARVPLTRAHTTPSARLIAQTFDPLCQY